jgi:hypothetical protein
MTGLHRILLVMAGIMGACGVMLAAASAHLPTRRVLRPRHRCCCFMLVPFLERSHSAIAVC